MTDYTPHMTDRALYQAAYAMDRQGGSFASSIAQAFFHADSDNKKRLLHAFGDLFEKFAPIYPDPYTTQGESK